MKSIFLRCLPHFSRVGGSSIITFVPARGILHFLVLGDLAEAGFLLLLVTTAVGAVATVVVGRHQTCRRCLFFFAVDHGLEFHIIEFFIVKGICILSVMAGLAVIATMFFIYLYFIFYFLTHLVSIRGIFMLDVSLTTFIF